VERLQQSKIQTHRLFFKKEGGTKRKHGKEPNLVSSPFVKTKTRTIVVAFSVLFGYFPNRKKVIFFLSNFKICE